MSTHVCEVNGVDGFVKPGCEVWPNQMTVMAMPFDSEAKMCNGLAQSCDELPRRRRWQVVSLLNFECENMNFCKYIRSNLFKILWSSSLVLGL